MIKVITGNEAAAYGALLSRPDVIAAYPITPQSRIVEQISEFCAQGLMSAKYVNAESEYGAIGYVIGASAGGARTFTATASLGLCLMHEGLHRASASRLPIVMVVANRPVIGGITSGQIDSLAQRDTGWMQFYCESLQEILDTVIQAYRIAETLSLPIMVCEDGFYLSYLTGGVDIPDQEKVDEYLPPYRPRYIKESGPRFTLYTNATSIPPAMAAMEQRYELHKIISKAVDVALTANEEFEALFGRGYPPVEEYKADDADVVLVTTGSPVSTSRYVIDQLREKGHRVGLIKLKMFRPFPRQLIHNALTGRKKIAVIERDISIGQCGIFYQEIKWALHKEIPMYGFVSGLGGADISHDLIEKAFMFTLKEDPPDREVIWLGLPERKMSDDYDKSTIKIQ